MVGEELVADVVEVADQRHVAADAVEPLADLRDSGRRFVAVDGDADELGARARQGGDLADGCHRLSAVSVLVMDWTTTRGAAAHHDVSDFHRHRLPARRRTGAAVGDGRGCLKHGRPVSADRHAALNGGESRRGQDEGSRASPRVTAGKMRPGGALVTSDDGIGRRRAGWDDPAAPTTGGASAMHPTDPKPLDDYFKEGLGGPPRRAIAARQPLFGRQREAARMARRLSAPRWRMERTRSCPPSRTGPSASRPTDAQAVLARAMA